MCVRVFSTVKILSFVTRTESGTQRSVATTRLSAWPMYTQSPRGGGRFHRSFYASFGRRCSRAQVDNNALYNVLTCGYATRVRRAVGVQLGPENVITELIKLKPAAAAAVGSVD